MTLLALGAGFLLWSTPLGLHGSLPEPDDSTTRPWQLSLINLGAKTVWDTLLPSSQKTIDSLKRSFWPDNGLFLLSRSDSIHQSILIKKTTPPVSCPEIHPCPTEENPEWIEILNQSSQPIFWEWLRECGDSVTSWEIQDPKNLWLDGERALFFASGQTEKSALWQQSLRSGELKRSSLRNSGDTLSLCWHNHVILTIHWPGASANQCRQGWNSSENSWIQAVQPTPGYAPHPLLPQEESPQLASHSIQRGQPIRLRLPLSHPTNQILLYSRYGVRLHQAENLPAGAQWKSPASVTQTQSVILISVSFHSQRWHDVVVVHP